MQQQQIVTTGPNVIGNADDHEMSMPIQSMGALNLQPKSTMKTRSAYKGGSVFVTAGVKRTLELEANDDF